MKRLVLLFLLLSSASILLAEDQPPAPSPAPPVPPKEAEQPPSPPTAEGLVSTTLPEDISTASYYELVAWCRQLGLDDSGSRADIQKKLYTYYKITPPAEAAKGKRVISVRSAKESEYFTVEQVSEKYIVLRGDVVVILSDQESGAVQEIHAQKITYNQTLNSVTAEGGVEYKITRSGKTDTFTGESLSFDVDTGEGAFYNGRTSRPLNRGDQQVTFFFQGDTISRLENDTVVLGNGSFTSCDLQEAPHWQMKATRVWILGPGEWALQNAVLSVGRIPMLYLPFFFLPGDELFFNPSIGYDLRKGEYLQTTTYLIGKKKPQKGTSFSFMQMASGEETDYDLELHGLFLRKIPPKESGKKADTSSLKVQLDGYSSLGVFLGLAGDFPPLVTFQLGLAESRSITTDSFGANTPLFIQPDGSTTSYWNQSSIFGLPVPFRFGMQGDLNASASFGSITSHFEYFSDPFFTQDFYTRSEGIQFTSNLAALLVPPQQTAIQSNLSWDFTSRADFSSLIKTSLLQSFSIPSFNLKFTWQSKETPSTAGTPLSVDPGRVFYYPSSLVAPNFSLSASGEILHYSSLQEATGQQPPAPAGAPPAPQTPASTPPAPGTPPAAQPPAAPGTPPAPGTQESPGAPPTPAQQPPASPPTQGNPPVPPAGEPAPQAKQQASPSADPGRGFRPPVKPFQAEKQEAKAPAVDHFVFRAPQLRKDQTISAQQMETTASIAYQVQPRATLEQTFDSSSWQSQKDVDFRLLYGTFETGGSSQLSGNITFFNKGLSSTLTLAADGTYRNRYSPSSSLTPSQWQSLLLGDLQQDRFALRSIFQSTVLPLAQVPLLSASNLNYRLNLRLYQLSTIGSDPLNPQFNGVGPAWDQTAISEHALQGTLALKAFDQSQTLAVTAQLPPLNQSLMARLDTGIWIFKTYAQGGATQLAGVWQYQPLVAGEIVQFSTDANISEELQFDVSGRALSKSTSQLKLWGLTSTFTAENMYPVDHWLGTQLTGAAQQFLPSLFRVEYNYSGGPIWLWKNRIKLDPTLKTSWYLNLQKYADNSLDFTLSLNFSIFKFLDLSFSSTSYNNKTYRWIPGWPESVPGGGESEVNPLVDLLRSFNFFNTSDRFLSSFKLRSLSLKAVHHLHDWDVTLEYQGSPQLQTIGGVPQYAWTPAFAIQVQWVPVPEVRTRMYQDTTGAFYIRD